MKTWQELTKEELVNLYSQYTSAQLAEMFGVSKYQVQKKCKDLCIREACAIQHVNKRLKEGERPEVLQEVKGIGYDRFAKAVTHFVFRNGPIEDMHAEGKLSQNDMKTLNKFLYNRLGHVFKLIEQEDIVNLYRLY